MKKLTIPLFIPKIGNEIDYKSLNYIIRDIDDCNIIIGNYKLNKISDIASNLNKTPPNIPVWGDFCFGSINIFLKKGCISFIRVI